MPVARVALPVAASTSFDYWVPEGFPAPCGALVRVKLAGRPLIGIVVELLEHTDIPRERLQPVEAAMPQMPALPADLLELGSFVASYYQEPLGLVLAQMIPPLRATSRAAASGLDEPAAPLRFTASGRTSLATKLQRAPRLQALHARWLAAPDSILTTEAQAALPAYLRNAVKRWLAAGFAERASSSDAGETAARVTRPTAARLNEDQQRALGAIVLAQRRFA